MSNFQNIGVLISVHNEGNKLKDAINSLHTQTYNNFKIYIVDDNSTDPTTIELLNNFSQSNLGTVFFLDKNVGLSGARNYAIARMSVDLIVPLDADDILPNNTIEIISTYLFEYPNVDFFYGNYIIHHIDDNKTEIRSLNNHTSELGFLDFSTILNSWYLLGNSPFKKALWEKVSGYSIEFSNTCQDVDFFLKTFAIHSKGKFIDSVIYEWRRSNKGMNANNGSISDLYYSQLRNFDVYFNFDCNYRNRLMYISKYFYDQNKELNQYSKYLENTLRQFKNSRTILFLNKIKSFNIFFKSKDDNY
jgi:glycosyltransferase involved in cell wall biosynthesis